jgi:VanZ family protein
MKISTQLYIGWVVLIALITLVPGRVLPNIDWNFLSFDKIIHFSIFSILSFLGSASFKNILGSPTNVLKPISLSLLIAMVYGTLLEYLQTLIPDRGFDYADLLANIGGAIIGIVLFQLYNTKFSK